TVSGADAQVTAAIALHGLERDLAQSGYGFASADLLGCTLRWTLPAVAPISTPVPLAPVVINPDPAVIPPGDANTDTLLVIYGNGHDQPQGNPVSQVAGSSYTVQMPGSFAAGGRVIASQGACAAALLLDRITAAPPATTTTVTVGTGVSSVNVLHNMGQAPRILAYAVRSGNLTVCDYLLNDCGLDDGKDDPAVWVPVAGGIVSLRAQYGRDTTLPDMDGILDEGGYDQDTPADRDGWRRVLALRLALVARSAEYESRIHAE